MSLTLFALLAGALGVIGLALWGIRHGRKSAQAKVVRSRLDAMKAQKEVHNEVEALPDAARLTELRRWVRKPR